jgi:hypothetical protein
MRTFTRRWRRGTDRGRVRLSARAIERAHAPMLEAETHSVTATQYNR